MITGVRLEMLFWANFEFFFQYAGRCPLGDVDWEDGTQCSHYGETVLVKIWQKAAERGHTDEEERKTD